MKKKTGAPESRFDAYLKRHQVTESSYFNRLAQPQESSTVESLPAVLPAVAQGPRTKLLVTPERRFWGLLGLTNLHGAQGGTPGGASMCGPCASDLGPYSWIRGFIGVEF